MLASFQVNRENWSTPFLEAYLQTLSHFCQPVLQLESQLMFFRWVKRSISMNFNQLGVGLKIDMLFFRPFFSSRLKQIDFARRRELPYESYKNFDTFCYERDYFLFSFLQSQVVSTWSKHLANGSFGSLNRSANKFFNLWTVHCYFWATIMRIAFPKCDYFQLIIRDSQFLEKFERLIKNLMIIFGFAKNAPKNLWRSN